MEKWYWLNPIYRAVACVVAVERLRKLPSVSGSESAFCHLETLPSVRLVHRFSCLDLETLQVFADLIQKIGALESNQPNVPIVSLEGC